MKFWVAIGSVMLGLCGSAQGATVELRATDSVQRLAVHEPARDVRIQVFRRGVKLDQALAPDRCSATYQDERLIVKAHVCTGRSKIVFEYVAFASRVPFRLVYR